MSKASKRKGGAAAGPTPADDAPIRVDKMSHGRRILLMAIAIFCLLIFSVTGPMSDTIGGWFFAGDSKVYATMELPSGTTEISIEDYRNAITLQEFEARLFQQSVEKTEEEVLFIAALGKLADEFEVVTTAQELRDLLLMYTRNDKANYSALYRGMGYRYPADFEMMLGRVLRLQKVRQLLASAAVVTEDDVLREWTDLYREIRYSYSVWRPSEFVEAAQALTPSEADLAAYFEKDLSPMQRASLEREDAVSFDLMVVDAAAADSEGVQRLIGSDFEPSAAAMEEFYNSRSLSLYRRPLPEGETKLPEGVSAVLSMEEVGARLKRDFRIHVSLKQAYLTLAGGADAATFAAEHGLRIQNYAEPVAMSELEKVETYGSFQMRAMPSATVGTWMENPVLKPDGLGYLMRPLSVRPRAMPTLEEVREPVLVFWREREQGRLAREAAESFIKSLPKQTDWIDGDAVVIQADAFGQAMDAERRPQVHVDWIARTPRFSQDPIWPSEDAVLRRARSLLSGRLTELVDGQVVGPEDFGADGFLVAHLQGRRDPDRATIWPGEVDRARMLAQQKSGQQFQTDQLSFEGFAKAWKLTKVLVTEPDPVL